MGRARPASGGASAAAMRRHARAIFQAALATADPTEAVVRYLRGRRGLDRFRRIYVVGAGKAGASMAQGVERALGRRITGGLINVKDGHLAKLRRIELNECGHPLPDRRGADGALRIAEIVRQAEADEPRHLPDLGRRLRPAPAAAPTRSRSQEKQAVTGLLLASGANIHEINAVRKHLSAIKGGQLARLALPATVETLLLSDVIGDDLDVIGSGPTAPDASTFATAKAVLEKYGILDARARRRHATGSNGACAARSRTRRRPATRSSGASGTRSSAATGSRSTPRRAARGNSATGR